jgi:diguanylate cyclase (GGDEF)-like protein
VNEGDGAGTVEPGSRSARRLLRALGLISLGLPPVLAYGLYVHIIPVIQPERLGSVLPWAHALLLAAILWAVGGCAVIWRLALATARPAPAGPALQDGDRPGAAGTDEVGALMSSLSRMLGGIEQQAEQINQFAHRLDSAYQELDTTNAQLKEFSFKDEVTGLYNRRFFSIRLEEEVSRYRRFNHPVSVMLLDLDGFKAVNDELGHAAGDETLRDMAEILLRNSRGINVICRYGGDEFAVLLVETSKAGARLYADRIREVLSTHLFPHRRRVTASFGIASLPEDVAPAAGDLLRAADEALYAAKRAGKNRVSMYEDIEARDAIQPGKARE